MSRPERATPHAQLLIVADDLTGTADSAVGCAERGLHTQVLLAATRPQEADVVAVDLDSRECAPAVAARRHTACVDAWQGHYRHLFKKVDSTLRGNLAVEIASLVPKAGMALVAPAYPASGRTTREGRQWLDGVPVEETEVWRNAGIEGRADLIAMLSGAGLDTRLLDLDTLRGDDTRALERLRDWQRAGVQAVVCDAEDDRDLQRIATLGSALDSIVWVGAAGLGQALPDALVLVSEPAPEAVPETAFEDSHGRQARIAASAPAESGPTLSVIGSMSSRAHDQADALAAAIPALEVIEIAPATLREPAPPGARQRLSRRLADALTSNRDVMLRIAQPEERDTRDGAALSEALGALIAPHLADVCRLIATGGATARAILDAAGIERLTLIDAPVAGMARLTAERPTHPLEVVTKAGGFGHSAAFVDLWATHVAPRRPHAAAETAPFSETPARPGMHAPGRGTAKDSPA
ncbi:four-carbon acid sugar kinase family protein [Salinicola endophyticus]|uniref:Four-carbon acid sugar kinase family protein n=1 Tax=Salinicola endophyticus TaxID=1949083 RepID=A0AB74U9B8_9GAMM